jgi:alanyl-tRNA synthetase
MTLSELRLAYLQFFANHGHVILPSASLLPENDPTTLFTGSGMQPMVPYLLGQPHPQGRRLVDSQKCFRAQDIEEVGDNRHITNFEMLGNWSLGDYFKHEQIPWMFSFLFETLKLDPSRFYVTVFRGNDALGIPRDEEAVKLWQDCFATKGVSAEVGEDAEKDGMKPGQRIFYYNEKKNWWSRAGVPNKMPVGEPGGPDTEMFWDFGAERKLHEQSQWANEPCHVNCDCGRFLEIGNNVFMQYQKTETGFEKLPQPNVDFGGGLERILMALNNDPDIFHTDGLAQIVSKLEAFSGKAYDSDPIVTRAFRIAADHIKAATFIIGDPRGVVPSNVGQGYVVRRLLRRAIREGRRLGVSNFAPTVAEIVIDTFSGHYTELAEKREFILAEIAKEEEKFSKTLEKGLREAERMLQGGTLTGEQAFVLFSTYGFPWELTEEFVLEKGLQVDRQAFESEFKKHQELSRTSSAGAFKGGLADQSAETTRLHTATHLLHRALKNVLGEHVQQKGSNITAERLRFDFSHPQKMTPEEITEVERQVNEAIEKDFPVACSEHTTEEAKSTGALGYFEDKYAQVAGKIKVYSVGDEARGYFSKEICGGPHVTHTGELGSFKIQKEEAVSAGVRRIKAEVTGPKV